MADILRALLPIFLLILLGWGMRKRRFLPDGFWPAAEKLTYYVTFPALLVGNLAKADFSTFAALPLAGTVGAATLGGAILMVVSRPMWGHDGPAFTSYFQGAIRANSYVGLAAGAALFGDAGLTMVAICLAMVVPLVNLLCVSVLLTCVPDDRAAPAGPGLRGFVKPIATNPLILACLTGLLINLMGNGLPSLIDATLEVLGRASLPLGLLAVGAGLSLRGLRGVGAKIALNGSVKLLIVPMLALGVARLFDLGPMETAIAVIYCGLPCAPSAYILARQMSGDASLVAQIITTQTLTASLSLTALAYLM